MKRWWLTTSDVFASLPEAINFPVMFDGGGANGHWHFRVGGSLPAQPAAVFAERPAQYVVSADEWIDFKSLPFTYADKEALKSVARERAPFKISDGQKSILDALVQLSLEQPGGVVSGRRLRAVTKAVDAGAFVAQLGHLKPRYVECRHDSFQPTFEGLLMSSRRERAIAIVDAVLAVLRTGFTANPDVESFTLRDLLAAGVREDEKALAAAVINTALLWEAPALDGWRVPQDVEQLVSRVPDFAAFRDYCRDSRTAPPRSWDLAPAMLPNEISDDRIHEWWSPAEAVPQAQPTASPFHVFYSWQSDRPGATNHTLILDALERALRDLKRDPAIEHELIVERDTEGDPGAPHIAETILRKVDRATLFVADVSFITDTSKIGDEPGRPTPNPNVMIELGYAMAKLGSDRILLVFNDAFGRVEDLPFDLRYRRVLKYTSRHDDSDRATPRQRLQRVFEEAIRNHIGGVSVR